MSVVTREVRWFASCDVPDALEREFEDLRPEIRTDLYVPATADFGLKARSGRLELKVRLSVSVVGDVLLESWEKTRAAAPNLVAAIGAGPAVEVTKVRRQRVDAIDGIRPSAAELTALRVTIDGQAIGRWWTVAAEAFGPRWEHAAFDHPLRSFVDPWLPLLETCDAQAASYATWVCALGGYGSAGSGR